MRQTLLFLIMFFSLLGISIAQTNFQLNPNSDKTEIIFNKDNKPIKIKNYEPITLSTILKSQPLSLLSQKICNFAPTLCKTSEYLANDYYVKRYFERMYVSILLHESNYFQFTKNPNDSRIIGYAQINTQSWNLTKIKKLGYDIDTYEQLKDPKINIKVGEAIFWHNLVVAYSMNPNQNNILAYASSYYSLSMPQWYTQKLIPIFYNKELLTTTLQKRIR